MPAKLALLICVLFILWLYARDRTLRPMTSAALWIPLLWIIIIGTRPVSTWFGGGKELESPDAYLEGSPLDRNIFLLLIVIGFIILLMRRVDWGKISASNRWLLAFIIYCGISVLWSDYPFVGFKRWIKDIGNLCMVLIMLTATNPVQAFRAVFARYTYVAIPLSVVFIKYFPELGRYYNRWTWEPTLCGVTLEKNALGPVAVICGMFIIWDLIQMRSTANRRTDKLDLLCRLMLLVMILWLIIVSGSSTSVVCLILGIGILVGMRFPSIRKKAASIGTYGLIIIVLTILLYTVPGLIEGLVEKLGRNMTLTGRTDIWADVLEEPINPLLGTGYQSFWLGARAEHMWEKYYFHPNQAHNGFLETYLNGGVVGVCLLMAMIVSIGGKLKKELLAGSNYGALRFAYFVVVLFSNWTEATFNKLSLVWIIMIIAAVEYPQIPRTVSETLPRSGNNGPSDTRRTLLGEKYKVRSLSRRGSYLEGTSR